MPTMLSTEAFDKSLARGTTSEEKDVEMARKRVEEERVSMKATLNLMWAVTL